MKTAFHAVWSSIVTKKGKERSLIETLKSIPIFASLSNFELKFVAAILHHRNYVANELIFREGEAGNGMYIIQSGQVRIVGQNQNSEEVLFARLQSEQFFGELSLVDGNPRSASAIADDNSVLFGFFKPDLMDLVAQQPEIGSKILLNLASVLADRLRETNRKVKELQVKVQEVSNAD
jgi:CRP-like cAMP-binding protein